MTLKDESTSPMMDCDLSNNISNQLMRQIVKESEFYYKNNRRQMIAIFICALISCFAGLALLIFPHCILQMRQKLWELLVVLLLILYPV